MAEEIMNTDINSNDGTWGSADTIDYDDSQMDAIVSDIDMAAAYLVEVVTQIGNLEAYDSNWEGTAKEQYQGLKEMLKTYRTDYATSISNLETTVQGLQSLLGDISSANVIKEIDNA